MLEISDRSKKMTERVNTRYRKSLQPVMPYQLNGRQKPGGYDIYPTEPLHSGAINNGYNALADWILTHPAVLIDGFSGVLWNDVRSCLDEVFERKGKNIRWVAASDYLRSEAEVQQLIAPFLGDRDDVWGTKTSLTLGDFFRLNELKNIAPEKGFDCNIIIGTGSSQVEWDAPVIYLDVPKNEIQFRMRAGSVTNLGMTTPDEPAHMYKQCYFVDWPVLNAYKASIANRIVVQGDVQWQKNINWMLRIDLVKALQHVSKTMVRVRPWFEPGAWGGQWMKERISGLNKDEVNYAWSFEMIVPENGIVFESDGYLLEVPFDLLMLESNKNVLGKHADFFGNEFPIRFDFLDTWDGGKLSIQCHPSVQYIRENFGEHITQDETYYILDCKKGAEVYLGFQEGINPDEFRHKLEESKADGVALEIEKYVQLHEAHKHDLFLIPNGAIHSAGANNLVLEISSTPYIFTFKMYDWLRMDLNGEPRAINIEHAFNNLRFDLQGGKVKQELISHPKLLEQQPGAETWHLPTHALHFYDVHRLEFDDTIKVSTGESCNVLMLVEGESVVVETGGTTRRFQYAETFLIPAAAENYTLKNEGSGRAKVVKAFIKQSIDHLM